MIWLSRVTSSWTTWRACSERERDEDEEPEERNAMRQMETHRREKPASGGFIYTARSIICRGGRESLVKNERHHYDSFVQAPSPRAVASRIVCHQPPVVNDKFLFISFLNPTRHRKRVRRNSDAAVRPEERLILDVDSQPTGDWLTNIP